MFKYIKQLIYRFRGEVTTETEIKNGMIVGSNFKRQNHVFLDPGHCWLIEIGDNVTMAPGVKVFCHDASTKRWLGYAKIGRVKIGDNVFIGADSVILPGVEIGNNVIIGANSTVCNDIFDNSVCAGTPARKIYDLDSYLEKERQQMKNSFVYDNSYTVRGGVSNPKKEQQKTELRNGKKGYII